MDRSELARDLEHQVSQTLRTIPSQRTQGAAGSQIPTNLGAVIPVPPPFHPGSPPAAPVEPSAPTFGRARRKDKFAYWLKTAVRWAAYVFAAWLTVVLALVFVYRYIDPPISALMLKQRLSGVGYDHSFVPLSEISANAARAVIVSEDARFCQHWGVDYDAMQTALERAGSGTPRGASTISMQVAKNLFLWPSKSYLRKVLEIPLTYLIEAWWPKRRIMEIYLNVAEWGPGVFGIEAAANHHFSKPARRLSAREAAQLAAVLPNPIRRDAGDPGPQTRRLASLIELRARRAPRGTFACLQK